MLNPPRFTTQFAPLSVFLSGAIAWSLTCAPCVAAPQAAPSAAPRAPSAPAAPGGPRQAAPGVPAQPMNQQQALAEKEREVARQVAACPVKAVPALVDAGFVQPHTEVKLEAKLINTLDRPVTCVKSVPSCTCTTVDMVGKVIPAKGTLSMPVAMKTSGATGDKTATVLLVFEGAPGELIPGVVEIKLRAEVVYPVRGYQVNPGRDGKPSKDPYINAFDFKDNVTGKVTVESVDGKPFRVLSVAGATPAFVDYDPASQEPRKSYDLRYDFSKTPCAEVPKYLVVETDRPDARLIDMRVRHPCTKLDPAFHFEQYRENLGVLAPGASKDFDVLVKMANGVRIDSVASGDPRIDVAVVGTKTDADSLLLSVRVTAKPGTSGVFIAPLRFTGVGPDPRMPVPPGMPAATQPRAADYLVYMKIEDAPPPLQAKPVVTVPAAVRDAVLAPAANPPAEAVNTKKITQLNDPTVPAQVVQPLPVVQRIAQRAEEVPMDPAQFARAKAAIEKGLAALRTMQGSNGGWMETSTATATDQSKPSPGVGSAVTGLVLKAFAQAGYPAQRDPLTRRGLEFVLKNTKMAEGFNPDLGGGISNYIASMVLSGLAAQEDSELADEISTVVAWLKHNQWSQEQGIGPRADWFGGAGYGNGRRPDLSNTQLMLDALHDAGVSPDDPSVQRALVFVARTQNLKATNPASWAQNGSDDGGFVYSAANGGESMASDAAGEGRNGEKMPPETRSLRSYGSMTYSGFKSLLYAGLAADDPRVRAAFDWIRKHYTFDENPGLGAQGHYYYLHASARALYAANARTIEPLGGAGGSTPRNWRNDLVEALVGRQRADGSWVNSADRWQEGRPELTTAYSVLALEEALKPVLRAE